MTNIINLNTSSIGISECNFVNNDITYFNENFDTNSFLYLVSNNVDAYFVSSNR